MNEVVSLQGWVLEIGIAVLVAIGSINVFFIKGLINKIDQADKSIAKYEEQIKQLREHIEQFSVFVRDLSDLKSEVAVLKYALGGRTRALTKSKED